jgi:crossover junction endodeoxyribonuclease RuvC
MLILGIDPGTSVTGYGILESDGSAHHCLHCGAVKLSCRQPIPQRLLALHQKIAELIKAYPVEALALEDLFYAVNVKSALRLSQARGVIMLAAAENKIPVFEYSPLEVKNAVVGYGRAEKMQVQQMLCRILGLPEPPEPNDVADALAVAVCHAQSHKVREKMRAAAQRQSKRDSRNVSFAARK